MGIIAQSFRLGLGIGVVSNQQMMSPLTPEFTPMGGFYNVMFVDVVITCARADRIYYTLDGSQPDDSSGSTDKINPGDSVRLDFTEHETITLRAVGVALTGAQGQIYGATLSQTYTYRE